MTPLPRVAVVLLRAEWFDSVVALPELVEAVSDDERAIVASLSGAYDLVGPWRVNSPASLAQAEQALRAADVDLVVLAFQVWAEDAYLIPLMQALGDRPLAVWCYVPWDRAPRPAAFVDVLRGSGPVGTLEGLGTLRNLGARFAFTVGSPASRRVHADLGRAARAGQIRRALRSARFGILPYRNEQMQSNFVDEFRLRAELGPSVENLSVAELQRAAEAVSESELDAYLADLRARCRIEGVSGATLSLAARASLGMAHLAAGRQLDVLTFNDIAPEVHQVLGLRPCLYPPLFDQANVLVGLEGDLGAAVALFVLNRLTGSPVLFGEIWFWDEDENLVAAGHAGPANPALAGEGLTWVTHDWEFAQSDRTEGAQLQFVARSGRVTLFQLRGTPGGWQGIVARGEAVSSEPWVEGYPHAVVRLDAPVPDFFRRVAHAGSTQHWALAYGDALDDVRAWCELGGIPLEVIAGGAGG